MSQSLLPGAFQSLQGIIGESRSLALLSTRWRLHHIGRSSSITCTKPTVSSKTVRITSDPLRCSVIHSVIPPIIFPHILRALYSSYLLFKINIKIILVLFRVAISMILTILSIDMIFFYIHHGFQIDPPLPLAKKFPVIPTYYSHSHSFLHFPPPLSSRDFQNSLDLLSGNHSSKPGTPHPQQAHDEIDAGLADPECGAS